jgi:hypothetical protein
MVALLLHQHGVSVRAVAVALQLAPSLLLPVVVDAGNLLALVAGSMMLVTRPGPSLLLLAEATCHLLAAVVQMVLVDERVSVNRERHSHLLRRLQVMASIGLVPSGGAVVSKRLSSTRQVASDKVHELDAMVVTAASDLATR